MIENSSSLEREKLLREFVADCELADAVEARSVLSHLERRRVLFRQGERPSRLFLLKAGEVVLTLRMPDGSVLGFRTAPGSLIGLPAVAGSQPYSMTATASGGAKIHAVSIATFREIIGSNPRLSFRTLEILAREVRSARSLIATALVGVSRSSVC